LREKKLIERVKGMAQVQLAPHNCAGDAAA